jgi:hypothetical protein
MRCGTESLNIKWKHINWYTDIHTNKRYLRIWVTGKTGARHLIAKHNVRDALERLISREELFNGQILDDVLNDKHDVYLFKFKMANVQKAFIRHSNG